MGHVAMPVRDACCPEKVTGASQGLRVGAGPTLTFWERNCVRQAWTLGSWACHRPDCKAEGEPHLPLASS